MYSLLSANDELLGFVNEYAPNAIGLYLEKIKLRHFWLEVSGKLKSFDDKFDQADLIKVLKVVQEGIAGFLGVQFGLIISGNFDF